MKRAFLLSIFAACVAVQAAGAVTRTVPTEYTHIQTAIDASDNGDTVLVLPGVYFERIDFHGKDITVTSSDPNSPHIVGYTVLNGEESGSVVTFANGETEKAVLAGFTIIGGAGTRNLAMENNVTGAPTIIGAGVYCYGASPTITRNVIARCSAPFNLSGNVVFGCGGAIGAYEGSPTITHNTLRSNDAYVGGGIFSYFGQPIIHNNVIAENSSYGGGGIFTMSGTIYNNTIVANDSDLGGADGIAGNLYAVFGPEFGYAQIFNNIIADARSGGGVLFEGELDFGVFAYNDVWGNMPQNYLTLDFTGANGNISADPLFEQPINRNYHLTVESPCINTGEPAFVPPFGQTDIDGNPRVHGLRADMGAYEYAGYIKPTAAAGRNVHILDPAQAVTLDGSGSFFYDPNGPKSYQWTQVSGPEVVLDDPNSPTPSFTPPEPGEYVFKLVVADGQYASTPDEVLVFVGANRAPVADAGDDRAFQAPGTATLDGSGSYDPDPVDELTYIWTQIDGPPVVLEDADTAEASFEGEPGQLYVFELAVTDGIATSEPSQVRLVALGATHIATGSSLVQIGNPYLHYPDISGTKVVGAADSATNLNWRIMYWDLVGEDTETFSTPGINMQPKIDGDLVVWSGGASITGTGTPVCTSVFAHDIGTAEQVTLGELSQTQSFSHPAVSGDTVVWVEHRNVDRTVSQQWLNMPYDICGADVSDLDNPQYFTIATAVGKRDPFPLGREVNDFDSVVDIDGDLVVWEGDGDIFAANIADLDNIQVFTVCADPARQYDPAVWGDCVVWTDERNADADIYGADISDPQQVRVFAVVKGQGPQTQPAIDGAVVVYQEGGESGGPIRMACITRNYGVLVPKQPDVTSGLAPALDGSTVACTTGAYGLVRTSRVVFGYSVFDGAFENLATGQRYDYLRHAVADARTGGLIVVPEGVHREKLDFAGNPVTVRSADPNDPAVVAATVLTASGQIVTFPGGEGAGTVIEGLTITGGNRGIFCNGASPTIRRCTIEGNQNSGVRMLNGSNPTLTACTIVANGGDGVEMRASGGGRGTTHNVPILTNCLVAGNAGAGVASGLPVLNNCTVVENLKEGIDSVNGTLTNCIVYFNDPVDGVQLSNIRVVATYCDIQGGWSGTGNLSSDPQFVQTGLWDVAGWLAGDYHLKSQGSRWDAISGLWTSDDATSPCIDAGDPSSALRDEPTVLPAGPVVNERINLGLYGGTSEASIAP